MKENLKSSLNYNILLEFYLNCIIPRKFLDCILIIFIFSLKIVETLPISQILTKKMELKDCPTGTASTF